MAADGSAWRTLYAAVADQSVAINALVRALEVNGYAIYDAYGSAFPPAYTRAVRTFVSPPIGGWTRILGEFDEALLPALSGGFAVIDAQLLPADEPDNIEANLTVWLEGERLTDRAAVEARTEAPWVPMIAQGMRLLADRRSEPRSDVPNAKPTGSFVPREVLPGCARGLFDTLNPEQAGSLFERMTSSLAGRLGKAQMEAARGLLQPRAIDWTSGRPAIMAETLAALVGDQTGWRDPDFVSLRDAYQLHVRRRDRPNAPLYPGDAEALAAVPNALAYAPVYAGKR